MWAEVVVMLEVEKNRGKVRLIKDVKINWGRNGFFTNFAH